MKTYRIQVTHTTTVDVKSPDEETAVLDAMEQAEYHIRRGADRVRVDVKIISEKG